MILSREEYFKQKALDLQKKIVNTRTATTLTSESYIWTYRTTNCDVVSVITTTMPIKDGNMKDINIPSNEPKRLKPPNAKRSVKERVESLPYDFGLSVDVDKKKHKLNKMLQDEKKEFMSKLNLTRFVRSKLESNSVLKLQALFRGFYVRNNFEEIKHYLNTHKMIRANIRSYLESESHPVTTLSQYRSKRELYRNLAAKLIQAIFKRYLSRQCYRRKKLSQHLLLRTRSAIIIQALVRGVIDRAKVRCIIEKRAVVTRLKSIVKIQSAVRRLYAKRKVTNRRYKLQWIAARMIQSWYRAKYSRRMSKHIKQALYFRRANRAAMFFQKIVRSFLAKRRVQRIRLRKYFAIISCATIKIQSLIRRFLGKITVQKKRISLQKIREEKLIIEQLQQEKELKEKELKENQALLESANIFLQAKKGNTVDVEDIFMGLVGGEEHTPDEVDENDDNLLTLSASIGNLDLLRKCLLWGFNINHRNKDGETAIMLACKNYHSHAISYLLSFHPNSSTATGQSSESTENNNKLKEVILDLTEEDIGFLFVHGVYFAKKKNSSATPTSTSSSSSTTAELSILQSLIALGLDVNSVSSHHGMTAIHAACEIGHIEIFKYLLKQKAKLDIKDDLQQLPLHKAVTSNILLVKWILGLDPDFQTYMSPENRISNLTSPDIDGKDCLLLSILAGKVECVGLIERILSNNGEDSISSENNNSIPAARSTSMLPSTTTASTGSLVTNKPPTSLNNEEIGWSVSDIQQVIELIENNNIFCFHKILSYGFDINWLQDATNRSLPMIACWIGDYDILELLLNLSADFSTVDENNETIFHYAVKPHPKHLNNSHPNYKKKDGILPFLLSHPFKSKCNISANLLLTTSKDTGENCFHIAAREGLEINIDLLIDSNIITQLLSTSNSLGMSPLMIACSFYQEKIIYNYIRLGANIHHEDNAGNNCFWYLFHPNKERILSSRRIYTSEYYLLNSTSISRKERDEEVARINNECNLIALFLRSGCHLYTKLKSVEDHQQSVTPEKMKELFVKSTGVPGEQQPSMGLTAPFEREYNRLEPGDLLLCESSNTMIKMIIPNLLTPLDAWRLLLASIRLDDGTMKIFHNLLKCGILEVICSSDPLNLHLNLTEAGYASDESLGEGSLSSLPPIGGGMTLSTPSHAPQRNKSHRQQSLSQFTPLARSSSQVIPDKSAAALAGNNLQNINIDVSHIIKLQEIYYNHQTLIAWTIRLQNTKILSYLLKKFGGYYNYYHSVDETQSLPLLHFLAIHGNPEIFDVIQSTIQAVNITLEQQGPGKEGGGANNNNNQINSNNINNNITSNGSVDGSILSGGSIVESKRIFWRYESFNSLQETPFMLAAKHQNFAMLKKFFQLKVNLRNALNGKYAAWVLAFVKRLEKKEKLTQTGRYGNDDELYFNFNQMKELKDFPIFCIWMRL